MSDASNPIELSWRRHVSDALGLELDVIDGPAPSEGEAGGIRYLIQEHGGVKIGAWSGPGRDLAAWRGFYASRDVRLGAETSATVCGTAARRQEAEVAAESATGAYRGGDGAIGHIDASKPAIVSVAVALVAGGRPLLIEWAVPASDRERYRAAEQRFLASLTCR